MSIDEQIEGLKTKKLYRKAITSVATVVITLLVY
jgi:hypothetical protein